MELNNENGKITGIFKVISLIPYFCFGYFFCLYNIHHKKFLAQSILILIRFDRDLLSLSHAISCVNSKYSLEKFREKTREDRYNHSQWINKEIRRLTPNYNNYLNANFSTFYIETLWMQMEKEDFSVFGPFIPLFVPWVYMFDDYRTVGHLDYYIEWRNKILKLISNDYFYITISQNDDGIEGRDEKHNILPDNIIIVSSGGKGHIPVLLFPVEHDPRNFSISKHFEYDLMFAGSFTHPVRKVMVKQYNKYLGNKFKFYSSYINWKEEYPKSKFICAPRGYGRNSYRLTEVIQTGRIPVYIYNDVIWLPYYDSINWTDFSIISHINQLEQTVDRIKNTSEEEIRKMRNKIINLYESHFTLKATMKHIKLFLLYGFSESDLRCSKYCHYRGRRLYYKM